MQKITTKSTSKHTLETKDLVLRETQTTRLIFRPLVIDNVKNSKACVKGWFIFQKKGSKDDWEDYKTLDLSNLKKGEWIKLELKAESVLRLLKHLELLKDLYEQHGIGYGEKDFFVTDQNVGSLLVELSKFEENESVALVQALSDLDEKDLSNIDRIVSSVNFAKVQRVISTWKENRDNSDELFWQRLFKTHTWILSQIFACPFIFIGDEYYFGGKKGNNRGGVYGDFLYQNKFTGNVAFIETKTPETRLIGKQYRGKSDQDHNTVYCMSDELTGGINQVLNQRKVFQQKQDSLEEGAISILNSKCILIGGKVSELTPGQKKSLSLFRNNTKDVEVIGYDELFSRIENFLELFEGTSVDDRDEDNDIPF